MNDDTSVDAKEIDLKSLRHCLGSFATGVAVVTTRHDSMDRGVTVNSFTSLSLNPPLVLWCLSRSSRTYQAFTAAKHFIVNVLAVDQVAVSNRFAFRSEEAFPADVPFRRGIDDVPVLEATCASFQCRTTNVLDGGDHVILVGEVIDFARSDRPGLVYRGGQYAVADIHPSIRAQAADSFERDFLGTTVRPALDDITRRFESFFDAELREAGINSRESQILGLLLSHGTLNGEDLANLTLASGSYLEETLESLVIKKLIAIDGGQYSLTPSGRRLAASWTDRLRSYRAKALGSIRPAEAEALQRTLTRLSEWINTASPGSPR